MQEPAWKKLVQELKDSGCQSVYLDRLRERLHVFQSQDELKREILREMASALGRSEDKVTVALLRMDLIDREIQELVRTGGDEGDLEEELNAKIELYNRARAEAQRYLWELTIHREALGFRRNEILREFYPIPPKKRRLGDAA